MDSKLLKELDANKPVALSEQKRFLKAFIYGDWGTGKTLAACRSSKKTLLVTSGDGGESTLHDYPELKDNVEVVLCKGLTHIKAIFKAIEEGHEKYRHFEVVVIDTISSICDQFLKALVENYNVNKDRHTAKPKKSGETMEAEGMGDYKFLAAHMRDLVPVSSSAPVDVIWIAHEREPSFLDVEKGNFLTRPKMPQNASDAVAEGCHIVGLMEKGRKGGKVVRTIKFEGSNRTAAKSRIVALDDKTIDVNDFWKIVEEWRKND